ncbi:MAG: hypothetical protein PVJ27_08660, partial [Candidatus Brocadiaceae bacterium]
MPPYLLCDCGQVHELGDGLNVRNVECCRCGSTLEVPESAPEDLEPDPVLDRDKFLLRQKHMAVKAQKYFVHDEAGEPVLYVERPYHHLKRFLAAGVAAVVWLVVLAGAILLGALASSDTVTVTLGLAGLVLGFVAAVVVGIRLSPKRHVNLYRDET